MRNVVKLLTNLNTKVLSYTPFSYDIRCLYSYHCLVTTIAARGATQGQRVEQQFPLTQTYPIALFLLLLIE